MNPARDLAVYLQAQGIGSGTQGSADWWLVVGGLQVSEQPQVALIDTGGAAPRYDSTQGSVVRTYTVQVRILGGTYTAAQAKAQEIYGAVSDLREPTLGGTAYMSTEPIQEPAFLGYRDSDNRPEWVFNVMLISEE